MMIWILLKIYILHCQQPSVMFGDGVETTSQHWFVLRLTTERPVPAKGIACHSVRSNAEILPEGHFFFECQPSLGCYGCYPQHIPISVGYPPFFPINPIGDGSEPLSWCSNRGSVAGMACWIPKVADADGDCRFYTFEIYMHACIHIINIY